MYPKAGNRTFVKFQSQDNCLKSIWYNCLKSYSTIVKLFANKVIGSRPYSTIVKKVHSHTGQLSKTSQMILYRKIFTYVGYENHQNNSKNHSHTVQLSKSLMATQDNLG